MERLIFFSLSLGLRKTAMKYTFACLKKTRCTPQVECLEGYMLSKSLSLAFYSQKVVVQNILFDLNFCWKNARGVFSYFLFRA